MWKKYIINICVLVIMFFILMLDKYILKMDIFGINISLYYLIILFLGIYLDTSNGIVIISILALIQDSTIGVNFGNIIISSILSFLILKRVNKILYEEKLINVILKNIILYFSYMFIYIISRYLIYNNNINYVNILNIMLKEIVFLTLIVIAIYPIFKEIGAYIGKEYKKKNIITKYF
ncbi:MAG: hypothetical protein HXK70_02815 [Clostridiales bacterium]|nr:hypothetical protein [Clostridiales bacterium]